MKQIIVTFMLVSIFFVGTSFSNSNSISPEKKKIGETTIEQIKEKYGIMKIRDLHDLAEKKLTIYKNGSMKLNIAKWILDTTHDMIIDYGKKNTIEHNLPESYSIVNGNLYKHFGYHGGRSSCGGGGSGKPIANEENYGPADLSSFKLINDKFPVIFKDKNGYHIEESIQKLIGKYNRNNTDRIDIESFKSNTEGGTVIFSDKNSIYCSKWHTDLNTGKYTSKSLIKVDTNIPSAVVSGFNSEYKNSSYIRINNNIYNNCSVLIGEDISSFSPLYISEGKHRKEFSNLGVGSKGIYHGTEVIDPNEFLNANSKYVELWNINKEMEYIPESQSQTYDLILNKKLTNSSLLKNFDIESEDFLTNINDKNKYGENIINPKSTIINGSLRINNLSPGVPGSEWEVIKNKRIKLDFESLIDLELQWKVDRDEINEIEISYKIKKESETLLQDKTILVPYKNGKHLVSLGIDPKSDRSVIDRAIYIRAISKEGEYIGSPEKIPLHIFSIDGFKMVFGNEE